MTTRRRRIMAATSALGGLFLFAYAVERVGTAAIVDGIRRVGWGLIPILALAGVRYVIRTEAWRLCTPIGARLPHRQALMAFLAGDAVGNVTPLGLLASEPTKALLVRHHLATRDSVTSLAIDNLIYSASAIVVIVVGVVVMLLTVRLPAIVQEWSEAGVAVLLVLSIGAAFALQRASRIGATSAYATRSAPEKPSTIRERIATGRRLLQEFSSGHPARLWRVFGLDMLFHAVAVLEAYLTLQWLLGRSAPTFVEALLFEVLNRVLTIVFKFVPFRVGVDEMASGALAPMLAISPAAGVSLAIVRKVRSLFWAGCGLALIGVHHAQAAPATDPRGTVPAHRT